jgi:SOS-response transcriptional repressor LexA
MHRAAILPLYRSGKLILRPGRKPAYNGDARERFTTKKSNNAFGQMSDSEAMSLENNIYTIRRSNLRLVVKARFGNSPTRLGEALGIKHANYVSRLLSVSPRTKKNIGNELARRIERVCGLPANWLDVAHTALDSPLGEAYLPIPGLPIVHVPILSWREAGSEELTAIVQAARTSNDVSRLLIAPQARISPDGFVLLIENDAMAPLLVPGELAFVDPRVAPVNRRIVLARMPGHSEPIVRQMIHEGGEGGRIFLRALNPSWPADQKMLPLPPDARMIGTVVMKAQDFINGAPLSF